MSNPAPPDLTAIEFRRREVSPSQQSWTPASLFLTIAGGVATGILTAAVILFVAATIMLDAAADEAARQAEATSRELQRQLAAAMQVRTPAHEPQSLNRPTNIVALPPPSAKAATGSLACSDRTVVRREENGWTQLREELRAVPCEAR